MKPCFNHFFFIPSCTVYALSFPDSASLFISFLFPVFIKIRNSDSTSFGILLIFPPIRIIFINYLVTIFIKHKNVFLFILIAP